MYHGITTRDRFDGIENHQGYNIPVGEFERHLAYLKRRCHVVGFEDAVAGRRLSKSKTNVILTFDDGYENNFTNAFRLLENYGFSAVFSLPTAFVCGKEPLFNDRFEHAVNNSQKTEIRILWEGEEFVFPIRNIDERLALFDWLMILSNSIAQPRRQELNSAAADALGVSLTRGNLQDHEDYRPLTADQIKKIAASGLVTFASHSINHCGLPALTYAEKRAELIESKQQLEELSGSPCKIFTVPGGLYDSESLEEVFAAGYEYAFTSDQGTVDLSTRTLNRNAIFHSVNDHEFVDFAHGPVFETIGATRQIRSVIKTIIRSVG